MGYKIFTDSACDISEDLLSAWGVGVVSLSFSFSGEALEYLNYELSCHEFYTKMRGGAVAKTAGVNRLSFEEAFSSALDCGDDILYLGFSSALSLTVSAARSAAERLAVRYPERKILVLDTLSASAGMGMCVYLTVKKKAQGAGIDEAYSYAEKISRHICHFFTVDDLVYLKRGGRVSAASAIIGNALRIKPILHMDDAGRLVPIGRVRGRRASLLALADKYSRLSAREEEGCIFISHGDSLTDAVFLRDEIERRHGIRAELICDVGPVVGAHAGPGVIALFFVGEKR